MSGKLFFRIVLMISGVNLVAEGVHNEILLLNFLGGGLLGLYVAGTTEV